MLLLDVDEAIRTLPGSTAARQLVVSSALTYLRRAAGEAAGDSAQRLEVAKGLRRVGDLQGQYGYANLGDYEGALQTYDAALALLRAPGLHGGTPGPDEPALQQEMAALDQRKGSLLAMFGKLAEAQAVQQEGLALAAAAASRQPGDLDAQSSLATLHGQHGEILDLLGDPRAAAGHLDTAILLFEKLVSQAPDHADIGRSLATGYTRRGMSQQAEVRSGPADEAALQDFQRARQILERLRTARPNDTSLTRQLASNDMRLGDTMQRLGRPHEAVQHHRHAVQELAPLVAADPQDPQFRSDLMQGYSRLSLALEAQGDLPASVTAGRDAVRHGNVLPASALANVAIRFGKGQALYALAHALDRQAGQQPARPAAARLRREACELYRQSLPLVSSSREQQPRARFNLDPQALQAALQRCGEAGSARSADAGPPQGG